MKRKINLLVEKKIKNSILSGVVFGVLLGLFFVFQYNVQFAVTIGLISGLAFGIAIYFFKSSKVIKRQTQIENQAGQEIILSGGANHFKNREAVGGKLYLLIDKLYFKSHSFNIQKDGLEIPLGEISHIRFFNTWRLIPNGLKIQTTNGEIENFVVNNRNKWRTEIETLIQNMNT